MSNTPRRMRSTNVALGVLAVAAATLVTGCAEDTPDYQAICVDPQTNQRIDDDECDDSDRDYSGSGSGFFWFYMATNSSRPLPAVGSSYNPGYGTYNGSGITSSGKSYARGGAPTKGASSVKSYTSTTVKSGGFGGKGVSVS